MKFYLVQHYLLEKDRYEYLWMHERRMMTTPAGDKYLPGCAVSGFCVDIPEGQEPEKFLRGIEVRTV